MPIAFLTGATGFVGGHCARALVANGWRVRALVRKRGRAAAGMLAGTPVEEVAGDLASADALAPALAGVDAIVHVAGLVKARTFEEYREVNVAGTERLIAAATRSAPAALFLLVSSLSAVGPARQGRPVGDQDPPMPVSWYGRSKREGEEAVAGLWRGPWAIVRPGVIYGPGDRGLFEYFRMAARGWIPVPAGKARVQVIAVEQVAVALARLASRRDLSGRTGFLCEPNPVRIRDLAGTIARLPRRPARLIDVPDAVVRALGAAETMREALTRKSRPFNADKAREVLAGDWLCDSRPLREALALAPGPSLEAGLRATWDWYRSEGWIPGANL